MIGKKIPNTKLKKLVIFTKNGIVTLKLLDIEINGDSEALRPNVVSRGYFIWRFHVFIKYKALVCRPHLFSLKLCYSYHLVLPSHFKLIILKNPN